MWNLLIVVWVPYFAYASDSILFLNLRFENDVKMYGTQTKGFSVVDGDMFENNVKMYGTQTFMEYGITEDEFENDVKMYGTQTAVRTFNCCVCLRMM